MSTNLNVKGRIEKVNDVAELTTKAGDVFKKQTFLLKTDDEYNNLYLFELLGAKSVDNFNKFHKLGDEIEVGFNVKTDEYKGKYYVKLIAWKVSKSNQISAEL